MTRPDETCNVCLTRGECSHTGAQWVCRLCWTSLFTVPYPGAQS